MQLITERLHLRPWTTADLEALHRLWSDAETIWWGAHTSVDQTRELLQTIQREDGWWAVEHEGQVVGNVFLRPSGFHPEALELGYHFRSAFWGRGFATEAARAVLATARGTPIDALVDPGNVRSQRVVRKLGFTVAGQLIHAERVHDLWRLTSEARPAGAALNRRG